MADMMNRIKFPHIDTDNLVVHGDLTVQGTAITEHSADKIIEGAVTVINGGGIQSETTLLGQVILIGEDNSAYGILYDPQTDAVRLGNGSYNTESGTFQFLEGEGEPIAVRDLRSEDDGSLVMWDAGRYCLVKSPIKYDSGNDKIVADCDLYINIIANTNGNSLKLATGADQAHVMLDSQQRINLSAGSTITLEGEKIKVDGSLIINEGDASGDISIAGGTIDTSLFVAAIKGNSSLMEKINSTPIVGPIILAALESGKITSSTLNTINSILGTNYSIVESKATGTMSIALGTSNESTEVGAITLGYANKSSGFSSTAIGSENNVSGGGAFAYGNKNTVNGDFGVALGQENTAGYTAFAAGIKNNAEGKASFVTGSNNTATANNTFVTGTDNTVSGNRGSAQGYNNEVEGEEAHAQGRNNKAIGNQSHAEGEGNTASGPQAHAEGENTIASAANAHSEGYQTEASGSDSHAEGYKTKALSKRGHSEGYSTRAYWGGHAEGDSTHAIGKYSHTEGGSTFEYEFDSSIIDPDSGVPNIEDIDMCWQNQDPSQKFGVAGGQYSHVEGIDGITLGKASHAEGKQTTARGDYAHAEGADTIAEGRGAHAEGNETHAKGVYAHSEGYLTKAYADYSHTEGYDTRVEANAEVSPNASYGHAEGYKTLATREGAHAEGRETEATGIYAHAEGWGTKATNNGAHAEGDETVASGKYSHSAGIQTEAKGNYSYAGGEGTIASGRAQTVIGRYNAENSDALFIVGNGKDNTSRSNIVTIADGKVSINFDYDSTQNPLDTGSVGIELSRGRLDLSYICQYYNRITGGSLILDDSGASLIGVSRVEIESNGGGILLDATLKYNNVGDNSSITLRGTTVVDGTLSTPELYVQSITSAYDTDEGTISFGYENGISIGGRYGVQICGGEWQRPVQIIGNQNDIILSTDPDYKVLYNGNEVATKEYVDSKTSGGGGSIDLHGVSFNNGYMGIPSLYSIKANYENSNNGGTIDVLRFSDIGAPDYGYLDLTLGDTSTDSLHITSFSNDFHIVINSSTTNAPSSALFIKSEAYSGNENGFRAVSDFRGKLTYNNAEVSTLSSSDNWKEIEISSIEDGFTISETSFIFSIYFPGNFVSGIMTYNCQTSYPMAVSSVGCIIDGNNRYNVWIESYDGYCYIRVDEGYYNTSGETITIRYRAI